MLELECCLTLLYFSVSLNASQLRRYSEISAVAGLAPGENCSPLLSNGGRCFLFFAMLCSIEQRESLCQSLQLALMTSYAVS